MFGHLKYGNRAQRRAAHNRTSRSSPVKKLHVDEMKRRWKGYDFAIAFVNRGIKHNPF